MKKFYLKMENRNTEEKKTGKASYRSIIDRYIDDMVLCNNIIDVDPSVLENLGENAYYYVDEEGNYRTEEEYNNDETGTIHKEYEEFYQYYLCNLSKFEIETLKEYGISISYSNLLECEVLCVSHFGTSWDYVHTDIELTEDIEEG